MKEIIICVDEKDNELGYIEKMDAHIKGVLHRALSIFIFNDKNELLELLNAYNIPFESIKTINNPENDRSNYHYKIATNSYKPKYDSDEYTYKSNTTLSDLYNLTEKARIIYNFNVMDK